MVARLLRRAAPVKVSKLCLPLVVPYRTSPFSNLPPSLFPARSEKIRYSTPRPSFLLFFLSDVGRQPVIGSVFPPFAPTVANAPRGIPFLKSFFFARPCLLSHFLPFRSKRGLGQTSSFFLGFFFCPKVLFASFSFGLCSRHPAFCCVWLFSPSVCNPFFSSSSL